MPAGHRLRITEIFHSLQGESRTVGIPTVFVRLTGCPLRCTYCDTEYAFHGGEHHSIDAVLQQVASYGCSHVCVTGGEPLAQANCLKLLAALCDGGYEVSLETSGAISIENVDTRVSRVVDIKSPESGEARRQLWSNIDHLGSHDQLKFVLCSRTDYDWARQILIEHDLLGRCEVLFSASHEQLDPGQLADWIIEDRLAVRLQVQMHKYLWGDARGR